MSWYAPLRSIHSLGSQARRPGSLAGLHEARAQHKGQFFTPDAVAAYMFRLADAAMQPALRKGGKVSILDSSVGSGRLLQFCDPDQHIIQGTDPDARCIETLHAATTAAGFDSEFLACGLESIQPRGYGVALINPPFSLSLQSPSLEPFECTSWGVHGPNTSALSHQYALHQALSAADVVIALLPSSFAATLTDSKVTSKRLRALLQAPSGSFHEEGIDVAVTIAVYGPDPAVGAPLCERITDLVAEPPTLSIACRNTREQAPRLNRHGIEDQGPTVTLPVTGDNRVRITHSGRRIHLKFTCGLSQAKVMNAIYKDRIEAYNDERVRRPASIRYVGAGVLDVETHLLQDDPRESFDQFARSIAAAGGRPEVDPGLARYFEKRIRGSERSRTPYRRVIYRPHGKSADTNRVTGSARETHFAEPGVWGAPMLEAGAPVEFTKLSDGLYSFQAGGREYRLSQDELYQRFQLESSGTEPQGDWVVIQPGRAAAYPKLAADLRVRAERLGLEKFLSWSYQLQDLVELLIAPSGGICGWEPGLGKARLALSMVLMSGCRYGLVVVEAGLIPEMVAEIEKLGLSSDLWQVIDTPAKLRTLRRINVISYSRLRMPLHAAHPRRTYARGLRRRVSLTVADEGHLLKNQSSQQSRALAMVSAKRRFLMTGSPLPSYPRNAFHLLTHCGGDGTAHQPYGYRHPMLEKTNRHSLAYATRGIDEFRDRFTTLEWSTNEFKEDMSAGAKREVPKVQNLGQYRQVLGPHILRRLANEPEVAKHIQIPEPSHIHHEIPFDSEHLSYYLGVCDQFAEWYKRAKAEASTNRTQLNLVTILARINAVLLAANIPQHGVDGFGSYSPLTSKQRFALDRLRDLTTAGHKTIFFATNPGLLDLLDRHLQVDGIETVVYHGKIPVGQRSRALNERSRNGPVPVLLATHGVAQTGLNLYQADRAILNEYTWLSTTLEQAAHRLLRPQQINDVVLEHLSITGSIDGYQRQMTDFKRDAARAGLDWATPELEGEEFLHLDTILGRFIEELASLRGMKGCELRRRLVA